MTTRQILFALLTAIAPNAAAQGAPRPSAAPYYRWFGYEILVADQFTFQMDRGSLHVIRAPLDSTVKILGLEPSYRPPILPIRSEDSARAVASLGLHPRDGRIFKYAHPDGDDSTRLILMVPTSQRMLKILLTDSGNVTVDDFDGELEIEVNKGSITGNHLGSSALATIDQGPITLVLRSADVIKPTSLLARNGTITLTVPAATKANLDFQTGCGTFQSAFGTSSKPSFTFTPKTTQGPSQFTLTTPLMDSAATPIPENRSFVSCYPAHMTTRSPSDTPHLSDIFELHVLTTLNGGGPLIKAMTLQGNILLLRSKP